MQAGQNPGAQDKVSLLPFHWVHPNAVSTFLPLSQTTLPLDVHVAASWSTLKDF